jgi:hypothetical protein
MRRRRVSRVWGGLVALAALGLVGVLAAVATAGQVLDWKSVPRESVARFERMRVVRHSPAPDPTDTLSFDRTPASPENPEVPEPPEPVETSGGIMKIGSDIHVGRDEVVHGDLSAVSGDITIEGHVEGDVVAMKGDVDLKSTARVDGDVVCLGGTLSEEPGAQVGGQKVTAPGSGSWSVHDRLDRYRGRDHGDRMAAALVWLLLMTLFGWVFVRFAPGRTYAATQTLTRSPGVSLGLGSLVWALIIPSLIALCLVVALLCITIIGIPLALAALVGYALFLGVLSVWGFVVGATVLGGGLSRSSHRAAATAAAPQPVTPDVVQGTGLPAAPAQSLMRSMLIGVGVLMGSIVVGRLLQITDFGPLHGFGVLISVLGIVSSSIATTIGAGALLRSEIVTGTFQRLWSGRRFGPGARGGQAAPAPAAGAAAPPPAAWPQPAPPPPPSPPTSFMPPETPQPPPTT